MSFDKIAPNVNPRPLWAAESSVKRARFLASAIGPRTERKVMLQLKCIQASEFLNGNGDTMSLVRFELFLNGTPTGQFTEFELQPDYCEVGDLFSLTAQDFNDSSVEKPLDILDSVWEKR
ncbi:MAG: hypothetical protein AB8B55_19615 [Mariniblastus sp.]